MSAADVTALRQNRLIRTYRLRGITDAERACHPEELGLRRSWILNRLVDRGVFVPVAKGRCLLDVYAAERFYACRRRCALIARVIAVVVMLLVMSLVKG